MTTDLRRGDVVLVAFPFVEGGALRRKRRPAVIVQADRYNRHRQALVLAAITSAAAHRHLPCKVSVPFSSPDAREAGLRLDSVVDCQTVVTIPREEVAARIGRFPSGILRRIDAALRDALGL